MYYSSAVVSTIKKVGYSRGDGLTLYQRGVCMLIIHLRSSTTERGSPFLAMSCLARLLHTAQPLLSYNSTCSMHMCRAAGHTHKHKAVRHGACAVRERSTHAALPNLCCTFTASYSSTTTVYYNHHASLNITISMLILHTTINVYN